MPKQYAHLQTIISLPNLTLILLDDLFDLTRKRRLNLVYKSKKAGKDQETIQSSTTPNPGYHMGK